MPTCPFCRNNVELNNIWCSCGANLSRYSNLPTDIHEIKEWLEKHEPKHLDAAKTGSSLLDAAKRRLVETQETDLKDKTLAGKEKGAVDQLIADFLEDCKNEEIAPTIDIGQLRRDRWRQWRRIPTEYRQHPPLRDFRLTPGYFFEIKLADFKDEICVALDGTLYKHQLNAPDPFPMEELLESINVDKLREALVDALVLLLKDKQKPLVDERSKEMVFEPERGEGKKGRFSLPFRRGVNKKQPSVGEPGIEPAKALIEQPKIATDAVVGAAKSPESIFEKDKAAADPLKPGVGPVKPETPSEAKPAVAASLAADGAQVKQLEATTKKSLEPGAPSRETVNEQAAEAQKPEKTKRFSFSLPTFGRKTALPEVDPAIGPAADKGDRQEKDVAAKIDAAGKGTPGATPDKGAAIKQDLEKEDLEKEPGATRFGLPFFGKRRDEEVINEPGPERSEEAIRAEKTGVQVGQDANVGRESEAAPKKLFGFLKLGRKTEGGPETERSDTAKSAAVADEKITARADEAEAIVLPSGVLNKEERSFGGWSIFKRKRKEEDQQKAVLTGATQPKADEQAAGKERVIEKQTEKVDTQTEKHIATAQRPGAPAGQPQKPAAGTTPTPATPTPTPGARTSPSGAAPSRPAQSTPPQSAPTPSAAPNQPKSAAPSAPLNPPKSAAPGMPLSPPKSVSPGTEGPRPAQKQQTTPASPVKTEQPGQQSAPVSSKAQPVRPGGQPVAPTPARPGEKEAIRIPGRTEVKAKKTGGWLSFFKRGKAGDETAKPGDQVKSEAAKPAGAPGASIGSGASGAKAPLTQPTRPGAPAGQPQKPAEATPTPATPTTTQAAPAKTGQPGARTSPSGAAAPSRPAQSTPPQSAPTSSAAPSQPKSAAPSAPLNPPKSAVWGGGAQKPDNGKAGAAGQTRNVSQRELPEDPALPKAPVEAAPKSTSGATKTEDN